MSSTEIGSEAGVLTNEFQVTQTNKINSKDMIVGGEMVEQLFSAIETSEVLKEKAQVHHTYKPTIEIFSEADGIDDNLTYSVGKCGDGDVFNKLEDSLKEIGFVEVNDDKRKSQEAMQLDKGYNNQEGVVVSTRGEIPLGSERNHCFTRQSSRILDKGIPMM
jgi:hypothetical protein